MTSKRLLPVISRETLDEILGKYCQKGNQFLVDILDMICQENINLGSLILRTIGPNAPESSPYKVYSSDALYGFTITYELLKFEGEKTGPEIPKNIPKETVGDFINGFMKNGKRYVRDIPHRIIADGNWMLGESYPPTSGKDDVRGYVAANSTFIIYGILRKQAELNIAI